MCHRDMTSDCPKCILFLVSMEMLAVRPAKVMYMVVSGECIRIMSVTNSTPLPGKSIHLLFFCTRIVEGMEKTKGQVLAIEMANPPLN